MATSSPCPSDDTLVAFDRGTLDADTRRGVLEHLDDCEICHEVVVAAARDDAPGDPVLAIGRYVIERPIGAGAMGIVFAARDPELDRRVALKLLRKQLADDEDRRLEQRLLGEARALAKLAHPNVVAAYEVARHDGELYLVMELIEGPTLTGWLAGDRAWPDKLAMLVQAGRGLAAAHAAGIIHRDFKLDNILVGRDGRARVTDFGLASGSLTGPTPEVVGNELALTMTGALAGTPLCMAPEVLRGEPATPASDQFSFAISLWTALHHVRPFRGDSIRALIADIERGEPRGRARIPAALRAIARRGMAASPEARWPSLDAMLAACERVARPRSRWPLVVIATAAIAGGAAFALSPSSADPQCDLAEDPPWNAAAAARVRDRLLRVAPARAAVIETAVGAAIGAWRDRWRTERITACRAGDEARIACLELQHREVGAVIDQFATADETVADGAIDSARRLPDPRRCATAVSADTDPALALRIAETEALRRVGKFAQARDQANQLAREAARRGLPDLQLRAALLHAEALYDTGDRGEAVTALHAAIELATERRDDHAIAEALVHLVSAHAAVGNFGAHDTAARLADAALHRAGGDLELAAMLAMGRCRIGWRRPPAEHDRGVVDCTEAARQWRALRGEDAPELAWVDNQLGMLAVVADRHAEALVHFQAFEERSRRSHGDDYVNLDVARVNRATAMVKLGRYAEAEPILRDLIARRGWSSALAGLAEVSQARGAIDDAIAELRRAATWNHDHGGEADRCENLIRIAELEAGREHREPALAVLGEATPICKLAAGAEADARIAAVRARLR
jgi:tRNA A-37 threonylcarbamoyl transferase component Bud32/tetratricopeptide (TPR) repeat protein